MSTETSAEQPKKARVPICVTEAGMATDSSDEQFWKTRAPISVVEAGMATETTTPLCSP